MFAKFDYFDRLEQPTLVLCNPNDEELATIQNLEEFNLSVNFNAVSELSLTISKEPANDADDLILLKRQILINLSFFLKFLICVLLKVFFFIDVKIKVLEIQLFKLYIELINLTHYPFN
jgi:hypothetical protein